jgi:hypothetical protein
MTGNDQTVDWRDKINPIFVLTLQCLRLMPRVFRALADGGLHGPQVRAVMVDGCHESLVLLPTALPQQINELTPLLKENELFADPVIGSAICEVVAAVQNVPKAVLMKGFAKPHWWMTQKSWAEFLGEEDMLESMLNALALLQLKTPLRELTRRVASDSDLYNKLFRSENKHPGDLVFDRLLGKLTDEATKIVGTALLLKGEPSGHELPLRMVLFFGWDFGLRDLSVRELHVFLVQMRIIRHSHDPETLRKYRNRLRKMIASVTAQEMSIEPNSPTSPRDE